MKRHFRDPKALVVAAVIAVSISYAVAGRSAAIGMAAGIVGTGFNMLALWLIIRLLGRTMADRPLPRLGAFVTVVVFLMKLPVLLLIGFAVQRLGQVALNHFLIGLGLVYFALVGWSQSEDSRPA